MDFAVIRIGGAQYKVTEGQVISVNKIVGDVEPEVLLVSKKDKVLVGTPTVKGAKVKLEKVADYQGEKLDVIKFKAKSRYRRKIGFRPQLTKLKVISI
jgi:large subunit ribosomal protein L21